MRGTYGPAQPYTEMAARALKLWAKYERRWKRQFLHRTGVLWMASGRDDAFERGSVEMLRATKIKLQELSTAQMRKRWPQINFEGIQWGIYEPECGYLDARASCQAVVEAFVAAGGRYRQVAVIGDGLESRTLRGLSLSDGSQLKADLYVFACGPWLGKLFPEDNWRPGAAHQAGCFFLWHAGRRRSIQRRAFAGMGGSSRTLSLWNSWERPAWVQDCGRYARAGIRSHERRTRDQSGNAKRHSRICGLPLPCPESTRRWWRLEFVSTSRPRTATSSSIAIRRMENVWIVGGGSGHGFKHGPAIGEMMAEMHSG